MIKKYKEEYLKFLESVSDKFYSIESYQIPVDKFVIIKTDKGYISHVMYNDLTKEVFKDWNIISWISSDELDEII